MPVLRTEEVVQYHASLVLPRTTTAAQRAQRVSEVLAAVGLSLHRNTLVGVAVWNRILCNIM